MRLVALFVLAMLSWPSGATAASAPQPERAWEHARALVRDIGPRPADSQQARAAARHVEDAFTRLGIPTERVPAGAQFVPEIRVGDALVSAGRTVTLDDDTIVATLSATEGVGAPAILILAHVDTVAGAPGAVDNAAAVGVLLELARSLADEPVRPHDVIFAATAGEEVGLVGARALAAQLDPDRIGVAISLDLIGRPGPLTLNGLSAHLGAPWLDRIARAAATARVAIEAPLTHQVVSRLLPQLERSDHGVFTERGIPAFHLYHRGPGRIYLQYHGPRDDLDQIDAASVAAALAMLHAFALDPAALPPVGGTAATWLPFGDGLILRDGACKAIEAVMIALCVVLLVLAARRGTPWRPRVMASALACAVTIVAWATVLGIDALGAAARAHPQPWIHAPGRWIVATLLLLVGLLTAAAPWLRRWPLDAGAGVPAVVLAMIPGVVLAWFGVVALAWIPLAHTVGLSALGSTRRPRTAALVLAVAMIPAWACIDPDLLREASFHGFLPRGLGLAPILAVVLLPASLAGTRLLATLPLSRRARVTAVAVGVAAWLAVALGSALGDRQCTASAYATAGLTCELGPASP